MVQIAIKDDAVTCTCGYYDKSFDPLRIARRHNTVKHAGNLPIFDMNENCERSQLTGELINPLISKES